jgi:hypothetical protein
MNRYFVDYPRDFANEYTVYAVPAGMVADFGRAFPDAEPITRSRAIRLGWTRVKEAKRDGEQWFGGFADSGAYPETLGEALEACRAATEGLVSDRLATA